MRPMYPQKGGLNAGVEEERAVEVRPSQGPRPMIRTATAPSSASKASTRVCSGQQVAAETSKAAEDDIGDFDCPICLELLHEPVVGSCGHDFCRHCLQVWVEQHPGNAMCPVCRKSLPSEVPGVCKRIARQIEAGFPELSAKRKLEVEQDIKQRKKQQSAKPQPPGAPPDFDGTLELAREHLNNLRELLRNSPQIHRVDTEIADRRRTEFWRIRSRLASNMDTWQDPLHNQEAAAQQGMASSEPTSAFLSPPSGTERVRPVRRSSHLSSSAADPHPLQIQAVTTPQGWNGNTRPFEGQSNAAASMGRPLDPASGSHSTLPSETSMQKAEREEALRRPQPQEAAEGPNPQQQGLQFSQETHPSPAQSNTWPEQELRVGYLPDLPPAQYMHFTMGTHEPRSRRRRNAIFCRHPRTGRQCNS